MRVASPELILALFVIPPLSCPSCRHPVKEQLPVSPQPDASATVRQTDPVPVTPMPDLRDSPIASARCRLPRHALTSLLAMLLALACRDQSAGPPPPSPQCDRGNG